MGDVVKLRDVRDDGSGFFAETLLGFIAREGNVTTYAVSARFGGDVREAKRQLDRLRKNGLITADREVIDWGAINSWQITDAGRAAIAKAESSQ